MTDWQIADRISDRIVDLVNEELVAMRQRDAVEPMELLAGQLLGLLAYMHTAPRQRPATFDAVGRAARACLEEMFASKPTS